MELSKFFEHQIFVYEKSDQKFSSEASISEFVLKNVIAKQIFHKFYIFDSSQIVSRMEVLRNNLERVQIYYGEL